MIYLDVEKKIERLRETLHDNISKYGIDSEETRKVSLQLDKLINKHYKIENNDKFPAWSEMYNEYLVSYAILKRLTREFGEFPTVLAWNKYAKEYGHLSYACMQYISGLDWNKLRTKVKSEINQEKNLKKI